MKFLYEVGDVPVFVYAELEEKPDRDGEPAYTFGELRQRGVDGAAVFKPLARSIIHGELRYLTLAEVHELDRFEAPEYMRVEIIVIVGHKSVGAFAYAYLLHDFNSLPLIPDGRFVGPEEG